MSSASPPESSSSSAAASDQSSSLLVGGPAERGGPYTSLEVSPPGVGYGEAGESGDAYSESSNDDVESSTLSSVVRPAGKEALLRGTTRLQTFLSIFKGNVGPGCLSLPWAYSILGVPLGCATTLIVTCLTTYNAWTLVRLKRERCGSRRGTTYSDVGERTYGRSFRTVVDLSVITIQLAVCTVFLANVGENLSSVLRRAFGVVGVGVVSDGVVVDAEEGEGTLPLLEFLSDRRTVMTALVLPCAYLSSLPDLRVLAPSIAVATVLMFLTFGLIGIAIGRRWDEGWDRWSSHDGGAWNALSAVDWRSAPLATCAIMYSLEGDQLILPIESAMARPDEFQRTFAWSMAFVGSVMCAFATACVASFGRVDDGSVTAFVLDHATDDRGTVAMAYATNLAASLSLVFTYPLQLFPAIGLVGQIVARRRRRDDNAGGKVDRAEGGGHAMEGDSLALRLCLASSTYVAAIAVPHLKALIALAGAVTGAMTSLILPPLLAARFVFEDDRNDVDAAGEGRKRKRDAGKNWFPSLVVAGLAYGVLGTFFSVKDIVEIYRRG